MRVTLAVIFAFAAFPGLPLAGAPRDVVATFSPTGTLLDSFDIPRIGLQTIQGLDIDHGGNIWVSLGNQQHHIGISYPNDRVIKFSPAGVELLSLKGPMGQPRAVAIDSGDNIYVTAAFDTTFRANIFKFDATGNYLKAFPNSAPPPTPIPPDEWHDLLITPNDRLFASGTGSGVVTEFTTTGSKVRSVELTDHHEAWGLALGSDENSLWDFQISSASGGKNRIAKFDLQLNQLIAFDTVSPMRYVVNGSIELAASGNLLLGAATGDRLGLPVVYEISPTGAILNTQALSSISAALGPNVTRVDVQAFTLDRNGNYVFAFASDPELVPEPNSTCLVALAFFALTALLRPTRLRR